MSVQAPPMRRGAMTPRPWLGFAASLRAALRPALGAPAPGSEPPASWHFAARRRRTALLAAIAGSATLAIGLLIASDPAMLDEPLATAHLVLFALLFAWVGAGFFTALMGFVTLVRGDPHGLTAVPGPIDAAARTAIVMPICNEDIATVFGGLRATCASLAATGASRLFDVYVLSDTGDPALRAAELRAWQALRESLGENARVYYRWRRRRTKRKAGNVADFCRRWGRDYRYMVVLDADSVMSGDCLVSLVRLMEAHPRAGIVQTLPRACGHTTVHARAQQFLGRVAGRLFAAGLSYWQLGESHYWGHNAILRVQPFMAHCGLAPIPGRGGLAGEILSHDFVEAALMRRAGYEVWLVDLPGSYEQAPPHLIDELQRDRRWCQGNLQNARLIAEPGFAPVHRAMFASGAMAYVASPLWLLFVGVGAARWIGGEPLAQAVPPVAAALWGATLTMLLLPRLLGVAVVMRRGEAGAFGGRGRVLGGALMEATLATIQAPVRMAAHTLFVAAALTGLRLEWKSPSRDAADVRWRDAWQRFGGVGLLASAVLAALLASQPAPAWPLLPLWLPLLAAVPLAVWTSRTAPGHWLRRRRWWVIPEEAQPPSLLQRLWPRTRSSQGGPATSHALAMRRTRPVLAPWVPPLGMAMRAAAVVVLAALPLASLPGPATPQVAFAYVAAVPARFVEPDPAPARVAAAKVRRAAIDRKARTIKRLPARL